MQLWIFSSVEQMTAKVYLCEISVKSECKLQVEILHTVKQEVVQGHTLVYCMEKRYREATELCIILSNSRI